MNLMATLWRREFGTPLFSIVLVNSKALAVLGTLLFALDLKIDASMATVIVAALVAISSMWQSWMLSRVHTLVNSSFTETKAGRVAAEAALKTSTDLNAYLQKQIDAASSAASAVAAANVVEVATNLAAGTVIATKEKLP